MKGLEDFRAGRFFDAHEEWEGLWLKSEGDAKLFLQALIQIAAACYHLTRGNAAPGTRLLSLAERKLASVGNSYARINTEFLRKEIRQAAERLERGDAPGEVAAAVRL